MPRARPDQKGPAASATDVYARPLSATAIVDATRYSTPTSASACTAPAAASAAIATTPAPATQRSTPTRVPTRSLRWPTTIRPTAPTNCDAATSAPAAAALHPIAVTSHTRPKIDSANCGTTSRAEATWMRTRNALAR
jgi:hypothetical protein